MGKTTRNVSKTMAKLDFSSLKTADLRSVAPVDETAIPRTQTAQTDGNSSASSSASSAVASPFVPASVSAVSVQAVPAIPESVLPASVPTASAVTPVSIPASAASASASRWTVASKGRISLTNLKSGGTSAVSQAAPSSTVSVPVAVAATVSTAAQESPVSVPAHSVPARHASKVKISLGTKPAVSVSLPKNSDQEAVAAVPPVAAAVESEFSDPASVSQFAEENSESHSDRAPVIGVDIIEAAKVVGTEGESIANEILTEALVDPEEAKKAAEEKAVAAVVIPDAGKEFFPNLEMDDGFFEDPLFEGIVPPKPEKKAVIAEESETEESPVTAEAVTETVAEESADAESVLTEESAQNAAETLSVSENGDAEESEETPMAAIAEESKTEEASVVAETAETAVESTAIEEAATASSEPTSPESYVETVAKDLTAERKGGLAKLFGERKVLVRAVAGLFAVAVVGTGAFSFMGPEIKTSGPEFANTGTELPPPVEKYVPTGEVKIVGEGVRVISVRRPNVHKQKKIAIGTSTGTVAEGATGAVLAPESAFATGAAPEPSETPTVSPVLPQAPSEPVAWPETMPESPESPVAPQGTGAVEIPASPDSQLPEPPVANPSENVP